MNMISTGAFRTEMDASSKQQELVKKLTAAWEKKNSKAARAGGVSLMALTLAACGDEDDTPFSQADVDAAVAASEAEFITDINDAIGSNLTGDEDSAVILATIQASDNGPLEVAAATALVAQQAAEATAAAALVAQAAAEAQAAQLTVDLAAANAATTAAQAAQAAAEADLETANADLAALRNPVEVALASANAETLAGTAGNDTFSGGSTFYDAADNVVDGSTTDSDTFNLTVVASNADADNTYTGGAAAGGGVEIGPNITNVENVNITAQSVAALEVSAQNMTGVSNLTVTRGDLSVGGSSITGNKAVVVFGVDAADVATVTTGAATTTATVIQATRAGITVNADTASGNVSVTGAATVSAAGAGTGDTVAVAVLGDATRDALPVNITTAAADVTVGAFTGVIDVNAPSALSVDLAGAAGGATIVAAGETGTPGAATTGIDVTGIDSSGLTVTTTYAGTSTAPGAIEITGTAATNDVATISAVGFNALDNDTTAVDILNLSGNGAAATYTLTGQTATTITGSGANAVNLAGDESLMAGVTISGIETIDLTAGTAGTIAAGLWTSNKVDLGFNNAGNAITVGSDVNYEVTADQTTGLDFDFSATANGNVTVTAGDDNGASATVGTITVGALDANDGATSTGTLTIEASIANMSGSTITVGAAQNIVVTGDEDLTFTGVVTGASFDASASSGIMTLSGLTNGVLTVTTGGGNDALTFNSGTADHAVATNAGNDTVTITATQNGSFVTGAGNDTINLDDVTGAYVVNAGAGNDTAVVSGDADAIIVGGEGTDILRVDATAALNNNTNTAISGFETLDLDAALTLSSAQFATMNTMNLSSDSGTPTLNLGGTGSDTAGISIDASGLTKDTALTPTVTITGTAFADTLTGGSIAEAFVMTAGADAIEGGSTGVDSLTLVDNNTDLDGTASGDNANGTVVNMGATAIDEATITTQLGNHLGAGALQVAVNTATFTFANGTATTTTATNVSQVQSIGGIENIIGGSGEDYIIGSAGNNTINGNAGDDYISAGDGDDTITVDGTAEYASDVYVGGLGDDTISITATTTLSSTDANITGVENITIAGTGNFDLVFTGQDDGFTVTGNAGDNVITSGGGADNMNGGLGADTIVLSTGNGYDVVTFTEASGTSVDLLNFDTTIVDDAVSVIGFRGAGNDLIQVDVGDAGIKLKNGGTNGTYVEAGSAAADAAAAGGANDVVIELTQNLSAAAATAVTNFQAAQNATTEAALVTAIVGSTGAGETFDGNLHANLRDANDKIVILTDDGDESVVLLYTAGAGSGTADATLEAAEVQVMAVFDGLVTLAMIGDL